MAKPQQIIHNDRLAAIVIAGQAIIDETLPADDRRQVQAMCLYALEIHAGERPGPYTHADAIRYAQRATSRR